MIGSGIGILPIGADIYYAAPPIGPNIFLTGTLSFESAFRVYGRVATSLDFAIINADDNTVEVDVVNVLTGAPLDITGATGVVSIYAPGATSDPLVVLSGDQVRVSQFSFTFTLAQATASGLPLGHCPWVSQLTLDDGSRHTVNCGDVQLTTGLINVLGRP